MWLSTQPALVHTRGSHRLSDAHGHQPSEQQMVLRTVDSSHPSRHAARKGISGAGGAGSVLRSACGTEMLLCKQVQFIATCCILQAAALLSTSCF
jgi:hypothetical protein